jgi:hypothetical protein
MANGDKLATIYDEVDDGLLTQRELFQAKVNGARGAFQLFEALSGQTVASDGVWMDVRGWSRFTFNFRDLGTGTSKIFGAVGNSAPGISDTTNYDVSGDITVSSNADKLVTIEDRLDFVRVAKTAAGDTLETNCFMKAGH